MPKHSEERYSSYTREELFNIVRDIENYPKFLPWCSAARILSIEENLIIAELVISFKAFTEKYTSKVVITPFSEIKVEMLEGPFKHLYNYWHFIEHPKGGTNILFEIDFTFKSMILEAMIGTVFNKAVLKMIEAFEGRAVELYSS